MALSKEQLLRNLYKLLAKASDESFYGQIVVEFQGGYPLMTQTVRRRKLDREDELDGVSDARLEEILTI